MTTAELILPESYKRDHTIKAKQPTTGPQFGAGYGGPMVDQFLYYMSLPGGGMLMFDLSKLTMADFRQMRDHYQVTISLWILQFMLHQLDWSIECENQKLADRLTENLKEHWPRLINAMSTSFWAGYSPNVIEYQNDRAGTFLELAKIKDLVPEMASVNWKQVPGYRPPGANVTPTKVNIYDGIKISGLSYPIPVEHTFWYPMLMENGNYGGRKLLRSAFPAYFFSQLMHLFSNRYFERFGEPLPIGRYPESGSIQDPETGEPIPARGAMEGILRNIRNRAVVALPSDRDPDAIGKAGGANAFEWDIEYLESQMRGADFERYMLRLDEEISLALFTPVLMYRSGDVGSYNLGEQHYRLFLTMLNAIAGDMKLHIDHYILDRLVDVNVGVNAPRARWVPRRLGRDTAETVRAILQAMISQGLVMADLDELSVATGMEIRKVTSSDLPPVSPEAKLQAETAKEAAELGAQTQTEIAKEKSKQVASGVGGRGGAAGRVANNRSPGANRPTSRSSRVSRNSLAESIYKRVEGQIQRAVREKSSLMELELDLGHERALEAALGEEEAVEWTGRFHDWWSEYSLVVEPEKAVEGLKNVLDAWGGGE